MSLYSILAGPAIRAEQLSLTSTRGWAPTFYHMPSSTGEIVNPQTATALSAYYACIVLLAATEALLPLKVLRKKAGGGSEEVPEHPAYDLLQISPNEDTTAVNFREDWVSYYLGWGHGYATIFRDGNGEPTSLRVLPPSIVQTKRDESGLFYELRPPRGGTEIVAAADMLDLRGVRGWSVAQQATDSLGIALSEQKYAGSYLGQASAPSGVLETDGQVPPEKRETLRTQWQEKHAGSGHQSIAVLEHGVHYKPISVKPADAQLLESRQYSVEEVCRWFGVPPEMLGRREQAQGWQAREHLNIEFVQHSLMRHLVEIEQETGKKLLTAAERKAGYYIRHSVDAVLRGDSRTRAAFYGLLLRLGALSPNEIRALEDMNPVGAEGDTYFMTTNLAPLDKVASGEVLEKKAAAPAFGGNAVTPHVRGVFDDTAHRVARRRMKTAERLAKKHAHKPAQLAGELNALDAGELSHTSTVFAPAVSLVAGHTVAPDELATVTATVLACGYDTLAAHVGGENTEPTLTENVLAERMARTYLAWARTVAEEEKEEVPS